MNTLTKTGNTLNTLNINIIFLDDYDTKFPLLSFSARAMCGEYYIYINPRLDQKVKSICEFREKTHILCNHSLNTNIMRSVFNKYFEKNKHKIFLRLPNDKNISSKIGLISTYIYEKFTSIAQDMEVNSRISGGKWPEIKILLEKQKDKFNTNSYLAYPKEDWPQGADWTTYVMLLCSNIETSLDYIGSGEGKKIQMSDITAHNASKNLINDYINMHLQEQKTIVQGSNSTFNETVKRGRTTHLTGAAASYSVSECNDMDGFINILKERAFIEQQRNIKTDIMYNTNRNKYSSNIVIPHRRKLIKRTISNLCILLDVSGSVPVGFLRRIIHSIISTEGIFNKKKSRLVCWSDSFCSDTTLDELKNLIAGGSTILSRGIEYCKKYLNENSHFFIISDFQDDIGDWISTAKNIKSKKTAIAYSNVPYGTTFSRWFSSVGSNSNIHNTEVLLKDFTKVFDAVLIRNKN